MKSGRFGWAPLRRLARDEAGNVIMLTAAAIFPLAGMTGAAFDIARTMLVRSRLQHACDASVLAYRRTMIGNTPVPGVTEPTARQFFNANFNPNRYGSGAPTIAFSVDNQVVVHGDVKLTLPMEVMQVVGVKPMDLEVICDAQLQLPNTDVMFVLDTTGSMTDTNPGDSQNKITGLRDAVMKFYDALEGVKMGGTQVRYGFVPYSNTVNVGMLLHSEWMVDKADYQSRVWAGQTTQQSGAQGDTVDYYSSWTPAVSPVTTTQAGNPENCVAPANDYTDSRTASAWSPSDTALPRSRTVYRTLNGSYYSATAQNDGTCKIYKYTYSNAKQQATETVDKNPNAGQTSTQTINKWTYQQVKDVDVSGLKGSPGGLMAGGAIQAMIGNPDPKSSTPDQPTAVTVPWNGCIEERKTLRVGETAKKVGEPFDEDVDAKPTADPDTQWRPFLPGLIYARNNQSYSGGDASGWPWSFAPTTTSTSYTYLKNYPFDRANCPSAARKLMSKEQGLTRDALQAYVDGLQTGGDTYHDIGFLWGVRLASQSGLFANENATAPNGFEISRNIIFMTDGGTESHIQDYDAYGLSALDRRRTAIDALPKDADQNKIVQDRLLLYCNAARRLTMHVWVIAFGTELTPTLTSCADPGRAYQANNKAELNKAFTDIASKIAQLRLTK